MMTTDCLFYYSSPIGILELHSFQSHLTQLVFCENEGVSSSELTEVMKNAIGQLDEYFKGVRRTFDVPLYFEGTPFQKKVWQALLTIPYGETISYKQLAERVGSSKAYRSVGTANGHNPLAIFIPCHRVIAADGSLGGYAGGLPRKRFLLHNIEFLIPFSKRL